MATLTVWRFDDASGAEVLVEYAQRSSAVSQPSVELFRPRRNHTRELAAKSGAGDHPIHVRLLEAQPLQDASALELVCRH